MFSTRLMASSAQRNSDVAGDTTMTETASNLAHRVGERLVHWYQDLRTRIEDENDFLSLDPETRRQLAQDCSINPDTLLKIVRAGPHGADEMERLLAALNIDAKELQAHLPEMFREMQVNCATCKDKGRCRHDLHAGVAQTAFADYCVNADELNTLRTAAPALQE
jgi:hypothetical protein